MATEDSNSSAAGAAPAAAAAPAAPAAPETSKGAVPQQKDRQGPPRGGKRRRGNGGHGKGNAYQTMNRRDWIEHRSAKRQRTAENNGESKNGDERQRQRTAAEAFPPGPSNMRIPFSAEEIAAEARRPKRKVAVLIGYAGTGYRGMQINHEERTIEGDLFRAFVEAGAIAKANADDPKKSSLVRCARTDKGVHAAGNVISLKLIVEDEDIVDKINAALPEQIRIWGILRTVNSFSCYQACDSRWYEYLLPSYALLPPHPDSYLGREMNKTTGAGYSALLDDVKSFWEDVERDVVQPILAKLDPAVRKAVVAQLHSTDDFHAQGLKSLDDLEKPKETKDTEMTDAGKEAPETTETPKETEAAAKDTEPSEPTGKAAPPLSEADAALKAATDQALRDIKAAYISAKRAYRITPARLGQLQEALSQFEGTRNFHNYTIQKSFKDASAQRHIKSFIVNPEPIQIRDTQWLSLKVHGQSFMMHQIRKMVAMAVMLTRCGTDPAAAMTQSYGPRRISIPRAPGFGLLLERPVFDSYNERASANFSKEPLDFGRYEDKMRAFKDKQIYSRIWDVEESQNVFNAFFHQLDNFRTSYYLWAIPGGYEEAYQRFGRTEEPVLAGDAEEDAENPDEGEG